MLRPERRIGRDLRAGERAGLEHRGEGFSIHVATDEDDLLAASPLRTRSASMLTSDMSLTMTATFFPSRLRRMWLSSVVFPDPRKPDRTVTGSLRVVCMGSENVFQREKRFAAGAAAGFDRKIRSHASPSAGASQGRLLGSERYLRWQAAR